MPHRVASFAELDTATLYALLTLRCAVFVVEQRCAYLDPDGRDTEPTTRHLWYERGGTPVAYLRLLTDPDGTARIGRVCTAPAHRGGGLAADLVAAAVDLIGPDRTCRLDAQAHLTGFYTGYGFAVAGPEFLEDGIPHVPMLRAARAGVAPHRPATPPPPNG